MPNSWSNFLRINWKKRGKQNETGRKRKTGRRKIFKLMFINVRPLYGLEESNNFSDIYLGDSTHNHNVDDIFIFRMASKLSFWILCVPNGTDYKERFNNKLCSVNQYFPAKLFIRRYLTDPE